MNLCLIASIAVLAGLSLAACQFVGQSEEKELTILYWQAPSVPSAYHSGGTKDIDAAAITLEPLARYDPDGNHRASFGGIRSQRSRMAVSAEI